MRCLNQELTFEAAKKEFELRDVEFGPQQMRTLKMIDQDNLYSNLGLLLSDQCLHTIKVAVFQGMDQTVFKDRREFTGSLMQQMNEGYDFIDFRNQTRATIEKLLRIDLEDIMVGISVCRNQDLANVFYRLHLIEAYGTGMSKIMKSYKGIDRKPVIETTKNAFKVILPNINAKYENRNDSAFLVESMANSSAGNGIQLRDEEEKVLEYARVHGAITRNDVIRLLEVSASTAVRILKKLVKNNLLKQNGKARSTNYTIVN